MLWNSRVQEAVGIAVFCAVAWLSRGWLGDTLSIAAVLAVAILSSWLLGQRVFPFSTVERAAGGAIGYASLFVLLLTGLYYASVPLTASSMLLVQAILGGCIALVPPVEQNEGVTEVPRSWHGFFVVSTSIASIALLWRVALNHQTAVSIRTPWPLLPDGSFLLFCLPIIAGMVAALWRRPIATATSSVIAWLSVSTLPLILYPLGYGFDGFIHRASETVLAQSGVLSPKPLYYLGQYVFITWLERAMGIPITWSDPWLLPLSLFIALFALAGLAKRAKKNDRFLPVFLLLFLPLGAFATTTPQALAYVLGWSGLVISLWPSLHGRSWLLPLALSAWAVACHPLGGLPFAILTGGFWITHAAPLRWVRAGINSIAGLAAILAIPLAFWAQSRLGNTPILWTWDWLHALTWHAVLPPLFFEPRQTLSVWLDGTEWNTILTSCFLFGIGIWTIVRPHAKHDRWIALTGLGLLLTQFVLAHAATFEFLISYERNNYTDRLAIISALLLALPAARWLSRRYSLLVQRSGFGSAFFLVLVVASWSTHVYNSLPRHDAAQASSGWSVGQADFEAVRWIHERAGADRYAVLANQIVSAAALQTYGFLRYEHDVFYYPLPTGGPLYQQFLHAATTEATTSTIYEAARMTSSTKIYVVINDYWWNAEQVQQHLSQIADLSLSFQDGRVWVYEFSVPPAAKTPSHN